MKGGRSEPGLWDAGLRAIDVVISITVYRSSLFRFVLVLLFLWRMGWMVGLTMMKYGGGS